METKMNKVYLFFIATIAFVFSGCYTSLKTTNETYAQTHVGFYINYDFYCNHCYYEMYWCNFCITYHTHINHWCNHHYGWYNNWYIVYYYQPYGYYHNHYHNHYAHRNYHRHYVRDYSGIRLYGNNKYLTPRDDKELYRLSNRQDKSQTIYRDNTTKSRQYDIKNNDAYKHQKDVNKRNNDAYKHQKNTREKYNSPPVKRNENIQKSPNTNRNEYKAPRQNNTQKSSGNRNNSTTKRK